jgi:hypothetical protein
MLKSSPQAPGRPIYQGSGVAAVGPDQFEARPSARLPFQKTPGSVAVLHVRGQNEGGQQQAQRIDQKVTLDALDLFAA